MTQQRPEWGLPRGVTRGLWDYLHADHIADHYDEYFSYTSLFEFDQAILTRHFTSPGLLVDFGCGTGRLLVPFARRGFRTLGVDLSLPMLRVVGDKAREERLPIDRVQANMTELDCLGDQVADYCICMFSSLGMVRGRANRQKVLEHARRILKPGGLLVLHVHNVWYNLFDPLGRRWLLGHLLSLLWRRDEELGDKFFDYRRIPKMFLHVFTRGELTRSLTAAGFRIHEITLLDTTRIRPLPAPWLLGRLRANGWIVVCQ